MIKKIGKLLLGLLLIFLVMGGILYMVYNESLPQGKQGVEADAIALRMLNSLEYKAYKDTRFVEWSFAKDKHRYMWDKEQQIVEVQWEDYKVHLNLKDNRKSKAIKNNTPLDNSQELEVVQKARTYFNNDSFWLVAPYKVFDPGTERRLVHLKDGTDGLLVTYTTGGDTPGDSYLWILDSKGVPESFKMWVKIIPLGGLEASWEGWNMMESGALLPTKHQLGPFKLNMGNVKGYD